MIGIFYDFENLTDMSFCIWKKSNFVHHKNNSIWCGTAWVWVNNAKFQVFFSVLLLSICSCFSGWLWNTVVEIIFWPLGTHCKWQHGVAGLIFTTDVWLLCLVPIRNILLTPNMIILFALALKTLAVALWSFIVFWGIICSCLGDHYMLKSIICRWFQMKITELLLCCSG